MVVIKRNQIKTSAPQIEGEPIFGIDIFLSPFDVVGKVGIGEHSLSLERLSGTDLTESPRI